MFPNKSTQAQSTTKEETDETNVYDTPKSIPFDFGDDGGSGLDEIMSRVHPETGPRLSLVDTHFVDPIPCPNDMRERFDRLPEDPLVLQRTFQRGASPADSAIGVTWMTEEATLGSINRSVFWTQRRPIIGYWVAGDTPIEVAVLRARFLKDGRDFSSVGVTTEQDGPRMVSVLYTAHGSSVKNGM